MKTPIVVVAAAVLACGWVAAGRAQVIERVSVANDGAEANGESIIVGGRSAMSADGRYVVFESGASNLVPGDTNGVGDVFVAHGPATVFTDGFESGELSGWSSVVP